MKRYSKCSFILSFFLIAGLLAGLFPVLPALAWTDRAAATTEDPGHAWTVEFDDPMNTSTMNSQNIYVSTAQSGTSRLDGVTVTAVDSTHAMVSPPAGGWSIGTTYYLIITQNVLTTEGMPLEDAVRMQFTVQNPAPALPDSGIKVYLEDQQLSFTVPPQTIGGRIMVPMRPIFEAMGASLEWDSGTQTATAVKGATTVVTQIGNPNAAINGVARTLDVPPTAINGSTLAPLRFVAEAFGYYVKWDGPSQTAHISASEFPADEVVLTPDYLIPGDLSKKYIYSYTKDDQSHSETYTWSQNADGTYVQQMNYLLPSEYGGEDGYLSGETSYTYEIADGSVNMVANEGGYEQAGSWMEYVTSGQYTVLSPVRQGESWSSACVTDMENSREPLDYSVSASFVGTEEMAVMGIQRTVAHIHLEQTSQLYKKTITCDYWLAPGIGIVKMTGTGFGCNAANVQSLRELTAIE